jgi:hypothetical protein
MLRRNMPDTVIQLQRRRLAAGRADWPMRALALAAGARRLARRMTSRAPPGST